MKREARLGPDNSRCYRSAARLYEKFYTDPARLVRLSSDAAQYQMPPDAGLL